MPIKERREQKKNASSPCILLEGADSEAFARGSVDQWDVTMFPLECLIHYLNFHQSLASSNFRRMLVAAIYHGAAEVDSPVSLFALLSTGSQEITLRRDCCRLKRRQRVTITPSHCAFLRTTLWCIATRIVIRERDGTRTHVMRTVYSLIRPAWASTQLLHETCLAEIALWTVVSILVGCDLSVGSMEKNLQ